MKNAKNARPGKQFNFWQVDHKIENIREPEGITILPSPEAWEKFKWIRKWFKEKPKEGYFAWIRKQVDFPLAACVTIASSKVAQNLTNILVVESNINAKADVLCHALTQNLSANHKAQGVLILKPGAFLEYNHIHKWGEKDTVSPDYQFILEKNSKLIYNYSNLLPPKKLNFITSIRNKENSSSQINLVINGLNSDIKIDEEVILEGRGSQAVARLRLVGRKNSRIEARNKMIAKAEAKGHLDCQGLLVDKKSKISLIPELVCENKLAQITHEASLGRISEEELNYLRTRGLTEKEAIDLIVSGFLK